MKASDFDEKFDGGVSVLEDLDIEKARRPAQEQRRINVDMPLWMIASLDREGRRLGVSRQAVIKVWLAECLEKNRKM